MNIRQKPDEKRRQKEDKYFYNSVMERERRKPRPTSAICKNFPGLSKKQLELCFRYPDVMSAAVQGLQLAVNECQFQFQKHRWNCSALERKNRNPHSSNFLQKGTNFSLQCLISTEYKDIRCCKNRRAAQDVVEDSGNRSLNRIFRPL